MGVELKGCRALVTGASSGIWAGLASGAAQVYVPEYFRDICLNKAADVPAFLENTAGYLREHRAAT